MEQQIDYGNVAAGMAMDATGSLINNLSNELQMERTFGFNERAAKKADARTRALFTDLYSPEAKVKQLKGRIKRWIDVRTRRSKWNE